MKFFIRWFGITLLSVYLFSCEKDPDDHRYRLPDAQLVASLTRGAGWIP